MSASRGDHTRSLFPSREIRAATRAKYIRLAAELAARPEPVASHWRTVSGVTIAATATRMGVSRTTLYRHWGSASEFSTDLIRFLLAEDREPIIRAAVTDVLTACASEPDPVDRTRQVLNVIEATVTSDPWLTLRTGLMVRPDDPRLAPLITEATQRLVDALARHVQLVFEHLDVVPVAGLTVSDLAGALFCVTDGLATAGQISRRVIGQDIVIDGDEERPWGLLAYACRAMVERCARPRRPRDPPLAAPVPSATPDGSATILGLSAAQREALEVAAELYRETLEPNRTAEQDLARGPLDHVTMARLARYAGVSRRAVHHIWPSQLELTADLLDHLLAGERRGVRSAMREAARRGLEATDDRLLHAVDGAEGRFRQLSTSEPLGHLLYAAPSRHPRLLEITRTHLDAALDDWAEDLATVLAARHQTTRRGVTLAHLAALQVLTEAAAGRLHRTNPSAVREGIPYGAGRWSATAILLDAVVRASVTPASLPAAAGDRPAVHTLSPPADAR